MPQISTKGTCQRRTNPVRAISSSFHCVFDQTEARFHPFLFDDEIYRDAFLSALMDKGLARFGCNADALQIPVLCSLWMLFPFLNSVIWIELWYLVTE